MYLLIYAFQQTVCMGFDPVLFEHGHYNIVVTQIWSFVDFNELIKFIYFIRFHELVGTVLIVETSTSAIRRNEDISDRVRTLHIKNGKGQRQTAWAESLRKLINMHEATLTDYY